jgi:hypothetical protein
MFLKHSCEIYVLLVLILYIITFDHVLLILHLNIKNQHHAFHCYIRKQNLTEIENFTLISEMLGLG